jgi:hypothetical protein
VENKDGLTAEKINQQILSPFLQVMDGHGLTLDYLSKKLKAELNAKKTDTFKAKVSVDVPATGIDGQPLLDLDNKPIMVPKVEEIVIYSTPMVDWQTRQRARKDALAYRGIIAVEKSQVEHSGSLTVETGIRRPGDGDDA